MEAYGMNTQEGGQMCQVLREHAQTLGTTHRGGYRNAIVLAMDGDKWRVRRTFIRKGGCALGINSDGASYTLNTVDRHIVAILGEANDKKL